LHSNRILPSDAPAYRPNLQISEEKFDLDVSLEDAFKNLDKESIERSEKAYALDLIQKEHP
jgi:hypothetical protein